MHKTGTNRHLVLDALTVLICDIHRQAPESEEDQRHRRHNSYSSYVDFAISHGLFGGYQFTIRIIDTSVHADKHLILPKELPGLCH